MSKSSLRHGCSPVNLLHIFRTPFSKNTSGGLLLKDSYKDKSQKNCLTCKKAIFFFVKACIRYFCIFLQKKELRKL